jgi:hypothetical protein
MSLVLRISFIFSLIIHLIFRSVNLATELLLCVNNFGIGEITKLPQKDLSFHIHTIIFYTDFERTKRLQLLRERYQLSSCYIPFCTMPWTCQLLACESTFIKSRSFVRTNVAYGIIISSYIDNQNITIQNTKIPQSNRHDK